MSSNAHYPMLKRLVGGGGRGHEPYIVFRRMLVPHLVGLWQCEGCRRVTLSIGLRQAVVFVGLRHVGWGHKKGCGDA